MLRLSGGIFQLLILHIAEVLFRMAYFLKLPLKALMIKQIMARFMTGFVLNTPAQSANKLNDLPI